MADGELPDDTTGFRILPPIPIDELVHMICAPAALTVMVMLRQRLGFRMVPLWGVIGLFAGLFVWANIGLIIGSFLSRSTATLPLYAFAFAFLYFGLQQHREEWRRIKAGQVHYSFSRGHSRLKAFFPTQREETLHRFIEPAACLVVGLVLSYLISWPLPLWLVWSALCLAISEAIVHEKRRQHVLDLMDTIAIGEFQQRDFAHFDAAKSTETGAVAPPAEDLGLPTDHEADDIKRMLQERQMRLDKRKTEGGE